MAEFRDRSFDFELRSIDEADDGLTFEGYAAVFNTPAQIEERDGSQFEEVIAPTAFNRAINSGRKPILMFNHGKHPLIGTMPLGTITEWTADTKGVFVRGRLTDNWLIQPVRDAIRDGAITGMSFRMEDVKDKWSGPRTPLCRYGTSRTITELKVLELGPVVSPAYDDTTAMVRSVRAALDSFEVRDDETTVITTQDEGAHEDVVEAVTQKWGLTSKDVYPIEFYDDRMVFVVQRSAAGGDQYHGLWQVAYSRGGDGTVTIGDPQMVQAVEPRSTDLGGEERDKYTADDRKTMASNGQAMPDGSYPIADKEDLANAIHAVGRGGGSHNTIRAHIIKRAKALGASNMIPDNWNADGSMRSTSDEPATTRTSDEPAVREPHDTQAARERYLRTLELSRRGIR